MSILSIKLFKSFSANSDVILCPLYLPTGKTSQFTSTRKFHARIAMHKKFIIIQWLGMFAAFFASIFEVALLSWVCFANCFRLRNTFLFSRCLGLKTVLEFQTMLCKECSKHQQLPKISFPTLRQTCFIQINSEIGNCYSMEESCTLVSFVWVCFRVYCFRFLISVFLLVWTQKKLRMKLDGHCRKESR